MLDENEFKPFELADFSVADTSSENAESISKQAKNITNSSDSSDKEVSDRIATFKPLTFEEEEISSDFILDKPNGFQKIKTDAEKIQLSKEFKTSEFFLENSLLTNAEEFAENIREGAKLHKSKLLKQIEEQANDTDRIHQKTVAENQAAEQKRKQLMSETETKVQQIKDEAYKEGIELGRMQGMQKRYDEAETLAKQANKILLQLDSLRKIVRFQAEKELVKLALQISKNIVTEEIKLNQDVIKNIVKAALHETEVQGKIYLFLHPDDYEFLLKSKTELEGYLSEEQNLVIRQNPSMKPGSINVESDEEIISRSIEEQFNLIEDNLNENLETRQAHLNEVDIDAHDFQISSEKSTNAAKKESADFQKIEISDDPLVQEQTEEKKISKELVETSKNEVTSISSSPENDDKKEDPVLDNMALEPAEESNKNSMEKTDNMTDSSEKKSSEQNSVPIEKNDLEMSTDSVDTEQMKGDSSPKKI